MKARRLKVTLLTASGFAPYGDVMAVDGPPDRMINQGMCGRYHDRAVLDFANGRPALSLFDAQQTHLPLTIEMVERHPEGSQSFIPVSQSRFLIVVADDNNGVPIRLRAFVSDHEQSINLHRGIWHGVLTPIGGPGRFMVLDRVGTGANLEEYWFDAPYIIENL